METGLISPAGENLLDFLKLRQVLSTYDGDLRDPTGGFKKGQSPCELLGGLLGFLSRQCRGLRPCVESVTEPEDSSPQDRREELQGRVTIPRVPQMSQSIPGKPVFPALPRLSRRGSTHTMVVRGTALWESLVGKPQIP